MSDIPVDLSGLIEELNLNFEQFSMLVDLRLEEFAGEKTRKIEELQPLLADPDTPPGILIAAQMAALRRTCDHDLLQQARYHLSLCREAMKKMDRLPRWINR